MLSFLDKRKHTKASVKVLHGAIIEQKTGSDLNISQDRKDGGIILATAGPDGSRFPHKQAGMGKFGN
jgi:hypothetical protein